MIEIKYEKKFIKEFQLLPKFVAEKLVVLEKHFREDPFNSVLHTKKLQGELKSFYSFRIMHDYRVIFRFISKDEVVFLAVAHRKDIYR
jgi:addiction module RelE/StbE family toxin